MWLPIAAIGATSMGVADVILKSEVETGVTGMEAVIVGLKVLVVAGILAFILLLLVTTRDLPTKKEMEAGLALLIGWTASIYCISKAGITSRAVIHCSVAVAIAISVYRGAKIDNEIFLSLAGLLLTTAATVWTFNRANPVK